MAYLTWETFVETNINKLDEINFNRLKNYLEPFITYHRIKKEDVTKDFLIEKI